MFIAEPELPEEATAIAPLFSPPHRAQEIVQLDLLCFPDDPVPEEVVAKANNHDESFAFIVVTHKEDFLLGYLLYDTKQQVITRIGVHPKCRRRGIGRTLVNCTCKEAVRARIRYKGIFMINKLPGTIDPANPPTIPAISVINTENYPDSLPFWHALGFKVTRMHREAF